MDARTAQMDAHHYWRQFPVRIYWDTPKRIEGTVTRLGEEKTRDGLLPLLVVQLADGTVAEILVSQARLTAELVTQRPAVGDRIRITYTGEAAKAAPGMNPAKEFTVEVRRPGTQTPDRTDSVRGSAASENDPGSGESS